jgi:serine/threonine protein kinase
VAKGGASELGGYVVEDEVGEGGMGSLKLGQHKLLERPAVLKRMRRELAATPEGVERFRREARAAASIHHPNVVAVYDCFLWRGSLVIAQEYVEGVDLDSAVSTMRRIPPRVGALIALEILRGLEEIHARGVVHRDVKPANILLGCGGETKIADFGIALDPGSGGLTQPGTMIGSPPYMPPEQLLGERVDYRGDLFAWGVVFYELLTGTPPFRVPAEEGDDTLLRQIQRGRFPGVRRMAPAVPRWLARLIKRCLRAKPSRRFRSTAELRGRLERRLGNPSPAHCRHEIARWLWENKVIEPSEGATRIEPVAPPGAPRRFGRLRWASAAALGTLAALIVIALEVDFVALLPAKPDAAAEASADPPTK